LSIGLRKGEALGLQWDDVDLELRRVKVRRTLQRIDGELRCEAPKTRRSRRTIPLPPVCIEALEAHRERQEKERAELVP
jgi:integrase